MQHVISTTQQSEEIMKFKRIIGSFLLASFLMLNITPSYAIAEKIGGLFKKEKKQEISK